MTEAEADKRQDPARALADELRGRRGIESRQGVLGSERVEYFRGKDFAAFFKEHPDKNLSRLLRKSGDLPPDWTQEDGIRETVGVLVRRGLARRVDRFYKKPRPGKKRLTKWPRKLEPLPAADSQKWVEDGLYVWTYDLPASPWLLIGSAGLVAIVLAMCLFPLAPYQLKILVVYASLALVSVLLGTIALRWVVAGATWAVAGRALWLLPNMLSETVGLDEAFLPLWELEDVGEDWSWASYAWQRIAFAAAACALVWGLHRVAPDTDHLTSGAKATHDQILEWLNLQEAQFQQLGAASNDTNSTEGYQVATGDGRSGVRMQMGMPGAPGSGSDMRTAEAIAAAAARRAAAQAAAQPPSEEVILPFEELFPDGEEAGLSPDAAGDNAESEDVTSDQNGGDNDESAAAGRAGHEEL